MGLRVQSDFLTEPLENGGGSGKISLGKRNVFSPSKIGLIRPKDLSQIIVTREQGGPRSTKILTPNPSQDPNTPMNTDTTDNTSMIFMIAVIAALFFIFR